MFCPAQEKSVTIQMEYAVHACLICWCDPRGNHFDPGGSSPGKKGCWKEEAQQELITQFTMCFSSRSWGSRTGSLICLENYLWVGFWQAGFDFQGVLGTLQKTVCLAIATSNLLAAIPHWNTEINHCYGQWLMCNTSCAPAPLWLPWHNSWHLLVALLVRELAQHPLNRAVLETGLWSVLWTYYWGCRKFFFVSSYVCGAFLTS